MCVQSLQNDAGHTSQVKPLFANSKPLKEKYIRYDFLACKSLNFSLPCYFRPAVY
jgi:hypothetical protein